MTYPMILLILTVHHKPLWFAGLHKFRYCPLLTWLFPILTFSLKEVKYEPGNMLSHSVLFILNYIGFPLVFTANNKFQVALPYLSTSYNVLFSNMPAVLKSYAMIQLNKHFLSICFSLRCCANTETIGTNRAYSLSLRNSIQDVH